MPEFATLTQKGGNGMFRACSQRSYGILRCQSSCVSLRLDSKLHNRQPPYNIFRSGENRACCP